MKRELVGTVTEEEKLNIYEIYKRMEALEELFLSLNKVSSSEEEKSYLYEKIVKDMGETKHLFNLWWQNNSNKYKWKANANGQWSIDFKTNNVYLIVND